MCVYVCVFVCVFVCMSRDGNSLITGTVHYYTYILIHKHTNTQTPTGDSNGVLCISEFFAYDAPGGQGMHTTYYIHTHIHTTYIHKHTHTHTYIGGKPAVKEGIASFEFIDEVMIHTHIVI
jgi:hypothetical protein